MKKSIKWLIYAAVTFSVIMVIFHWHGVSPAPKQMKSTEVQSNHANMVASDVASTASLSIYNLQNTLKGLGKPLQGDYTSDKKNAILHEFISHHPEFTSVRFYENKNKFIQVGQITQPDLQKQALSTTDQGKPYVSELYSSHKSQVSVTIGLPLLHLPSASSLVAEADMSHLKQLSESQDKRLSTRTILRGIDVSNLEVNQNKWMEKRVQGTNWRVLVSTVPNRSTCHFNGEVLARFRNGLTPPQIQHICTTIQGNLVRRNSRNVYVFKSTKMPVSQMIPFLKKNGGRHRGTKPSDASAGFVKGRAKRYVVCPLSKQLKANFC